MRLFNSEHALRRQRFPPCRLASGRREPSIESGIGAAAGSPAIGLQPDDDVPRTVAPDHRALRGRRASTCGPPEGLAGRRLPRRRELLREIESLLAHYSSTGSSGTDRLARGALSPVALVSGQRSRPFHWRSRPIRTAWPDSSARRDDVVTLLHGNYEASHQCVEPRVQPGYRPRQARGAARTGHHHGSGTPVARSSDL
jgi:hypothetical protein